MVIGVDNVLPLFLELLGDRLQRRARRRRKPARRTFELLGVDKDVHDVGARVADAPDHLLHDRPRHRMRARKAEHVVKVISLKVAPDGHFGSVQNEVVVDPTLVQVGKILAEFAVVALAVVIFHAQRAQPRFLALLVDDADEADPWP